MAGSNHDLASFVSASSVVVMCGGSCLLGGWCRLVDENEKGYDDDLYKGHETFWGRHSEPLRDMAMGFSAIVSFVS